MWANLLYAALMECSIGKHLSNPNAIKNRSHISNLIYQEALDGCFTAGHGGMAEVTTLWDAEWREATGYHPRTKKGCLTAAFGDGQALKRRCLLQESRLHIAHKLGVHHLLEGG